MSFVEVAELAELSEVPISVEAPGGDFDIALVKVKDEIFAIYDECSHAKVRLSEGDVDEWDCKIECYLHGANFDLRTGEALNPPATRAVPVYPTKVAAGKVLVDIDNPINYQEN